MLGVVLIDKPLGITSHDVIARLRRKFGLRRVGHAGTLDPLATGLLVVAVGPATRFLQYLPLEPKEYVATIRFGIETTTQDAEGEVVATRAVPDDLEGEFRSVLPRFQGLIMQLPPLYSAVKKDGKPLYHYARQGVDVERKVRTVHIGEVELLDHMPTDVEVRVTCSGGTYIRTWAHDIGLAVGCGAHLIALRRTKVGKFNLDDAVPLEEVDAADLISLATALPPLALVPLDDSQIHAIRHGQPVLVNDAVEANVAALTDGQEVVGIGRLEGRMVYPEVVIPVIEAQA